MKTPNEVCRILGIELPVIQAPMNHITNAAMVAAVSEAGGLGIFGPNASKHDGQSSFEALEAEIRLAKSMTAKPIGLNIIVPGDDNAEMTGYATRQIELATSLGVNIFACVGGVRKTIYDLIHEKGGIVISRPVTPSVAVAIQAQEAGADIFVATGYDEAGWIPTNGVGTFSIVPVISDALDIPVMAAGAINDIRGVRAAFALGAVGVYVGTRFIATSECPASDAVKELLIKSRGEDLVLIDDGAVRQRCAPTKYALEMAANISAGDAFTKGLGALRVGMLTGDPDEGIANFNTAVNLITEIKTCREVVEELMADFIA